MSAWPAWVRKRRQATLGADFQRPVPPDAAIVSNACGFERLLASQFRNRYDEPRCGSPPKGVLMRLPSKIVLTAPNRSVARAARGQIYVTIPSSNAVGKYTSMEPGDPRSSRRWMARRVSRYRRGKCSSRTKTVASLASICHKRRTSERCTGHGFELSASIAVSGGHLFVVIQGTGTIGEYDAVTGVAGEPNAGHGVECASRHRGFRGESVCRKPRGRRYHWQV